MMDELTLYSIREHFQANPNMFTLWMIVTFIIGCCIGSFLNVCIWRIPRRMSIVTPPSHCPKCGHRIRAWENIPLISWIFLSGKCSSCKQKISVRYFLVELLTGVLFALLYMKVIVSGDHITTLIPYLFMTSVLIAAGFIDCDLGIIPNEITYSAMAAGPLISLVFPESFGFPSSGSACLWSLISMLACAIILGAVACVGKCIFKREALGWGDVKYVVAVGACIGLPGAFFTVAAGSFLGAFFALLRPVLRKTRFRKTIKFGPFLAVGTYVWMLAGDEIVRYYLMLINMLSVR